MIRKIMKSKYITRRPHNHLRMIRQMLYFSKIIGLATFTLDRVDPKKKVDGLASVVFVPSRLGIFYNVILTILTISSGYYSLPWRYGLYYAGKSTLTQNIDVLQNVLSIIVLSVILTVYCWNQRPMLNIANCMVEVERAFDQLEISFRPKRVVRRFVAICALDCMIFGLFMVSAIFEYRQRDMISYVVDFVLPFNVSWLMIQYYLFVALIDAKFAEINRSVQVMAKAHPAEIQVQSVYQSRRMMVSGTIVNCLSLIREAHSRLAEISNCVSDVFSVPTLFGLTYTLFCLTYNGYFLVIPLFSSVKPSYTFLANRILYLICLILPIVILTFKITKLMKEFSDTGNAVHDLLSSKIDREARSQLKLFSQQLLHKKIQFTACGFFLLDTTLLQGMIGSVTTYMVILIQLQPGSSTSCPVTNYTAAEI